MCMKKPSSHLSVGCFSVWALLCVSFSEIDDRWPVSAEA